MLFLQIISVMFVVDKTEVAQHELKGPCILVPVPADLKRIQSTLPRDCIDEHLVSLVLKQRFFYKQSPYEIKGN